VVEPANHDPLAVTPQQIAETNLALAAKGNREAAFELGLAYMQGFGVPQDFAKAETMFQTGARNPSEKALVGMFYAHGMYFRKDLHAAERWLTAAGRPGDLFELAEAYKAAAEADPSLALTYYPKATAIYLDLLKDTGHPEVRRAQMELGNFIIDAIYPAGDNPKWRALNMEWARIIAQELLGQEEYKIAVDYGIGREDLPVDKAMWLRFCKRAAAYNIDLAQHFYAEAINNAEAKDFSGYDAIAWTRLGAEKQSGESAQLSAFTRGMTPRQLQEANAAFNSLIETRRQSGAYYSTDDSLRSPSLAVLDALPKDDPDVQLRRAFVLEKPAASNPILYKQALEIYRNVRNQGKMDIRFVLGCYSLDGKYGVPKNRAIAEYWLHEAADAGSKSARDLLAVLAAQPTK
jgi:TPR repeat protein